VNGNRRFVNCNLLDGGNSKRTINGNNSSRTEAENPMSPTFQKQCFEIFALLGEVGTGCCRTEPAASPIRNVNGKGTRETLRKQCEILCCLHPAMQ